MLGALNPLPFRLGGDPTPTERVYNALRSAQGRTNTGESAAGPEGGLRDLWTLCKARAIARSGAVERAVMQFWPATMTSALAEWEQILGIPPAHDLGTRQQNVADAIAATLDATVPGLRQSLQAIHPSLDILPTPWEAAIASEPGKAFGPLPGVAGPAFFTGQAATRGLVASQWPNYGTGFWVLVVYFTNVVNPVPAPAVVQAVRKLLTTTLPSWVGFLFSTIMTGPGGTGPNSAGMFFDHAHGAVMDYTAMF